MNVVILSARTGWHTDELCRALAARQHTSVVLPYERLLARLGVTGSPGCQSRATGELSSESASILDADAVLARIIPSGSLEQIIYRVDALHWIEKRGVPVMNSPRAIERSVDKFYTTALLQEAGLPTPETVVCESAADAMAAIRAMLGRRPASAKAPAARHSVSEGGSRGEGGGDVIIKPIFGSMGHGLVRVSDPDVAFRVVRSLEQVRAVFYVQRAVDHDGRDVRAFVVGGDVLGAIERRVPEGEWRTNVSRGGSARRFTLPPEWEELARSAAAAVGADYAGVDLLPSRDGAVFVLEVNGVPGWQGLQQATGLDVAAAIVTHLEHRVNRVRAGDPVAEFPA
jgi:RimK family alpha-L-glutamate ligase